MSAPARGASEGAEGPCYPEPTMKCGTMAKTPALWVFATAVSVGCSPSAAEGPLDSRVEPAELPAVVDLDPEFAALPQRHQQNDELCLRGNQDPFFVAVCTSPRPHIDSLKTLVDFLGLGSNSAFVLTANSAALIGHEVSSVLPRVIIFPRVNSDLLPPAELTIVQFTRGDQFVEVISKDKAADKLRFYVLRFEQECNFIEPGCDLAAILTEEVEQNWKSYTLYEDEDLKNTTFDCTACHLAGAHDSPKILRMQELRAPWSHWFPQRFSQRTPSDKLLTEQFLEAHSADQHYGSIPIEVIASGIEEGSAAHLEALIRAEGFAEQPNVYDPKIEAEFMATGESATWQKQFELAVRGEAIAVPYPGIDATDPAKRAEATDSYLAVVTGAAPRESLVDLRHLLSPDAPVKMGLTPRPGASGREVLTQMCARCHNEKADPGISRARFNIDQLDNLSRELKDLAIARMTNPDVEHQLMPPKKSGWLSPQALEAAVSELKK